MSLAARIAIGPSRGLAFAEAAMLVAGVAMVAAVIAARVRPESLVAIVSAATLVSIAIALRRHRARTGSAPRLIATADRLEVDLFDGDGEARPCRLMDSTLTWPGFSVISMSPVEGGPALHLPAFDAELAPADAWALRRFVRWTAA